MKQNRTDFLLSAALALASRSERIGSVSAVLAAAGESVRFGRPKPLVIVNGRFLFEYSLSAFLASRYVKEVILAIREQDRVLIERVLQERFADAPIKLCLGGSTRDESVMQAFLQADKSTAFVSFHDAARPLIQTADIDRVIEDAFIYGAASAGSPVVDSLKRVKYAKVQEDVDRSDLVAVSTPQIFLKDLYEVSRAVCKRDRFSSTDDNAYATHAGFSVHITEVYTNPKLTYPNDLDLIVALLDARKGELL